MIDVGVVGVGVMGTNHVRTYSEMPSANLIGVSDLSAYGKSVASRFNTKFMPQDQLAKKVDAVSIAVPTFCHYETAAYFLSKGIDVLLEKPITLNLRDADRLIELAEEEGRILQVGHIERFNPAVIELKKRIKRPIAIEANRVGNVTRITDSGVVLDLMIHDIDLLFHLMPSEPTSICGYLKGEPNEDFATVSIEFRDGALAHLVASRLTAKRQRILTVHDEEVYYYADLMNKSLDIYTETKIEYMPDHITYSDMVERPRLPFAEPLKLELESFISCVKSRKKPVVDGGDARKALDIAIKILKKRWILPLRYSI